MGCAVSGKLIPSRWVISTKDSVELEAAADGTVRSCAVMNRAKRQVKKRRRVRRNRAHYRVLASSFTAPRSFAFHNGNNPDRSLEFNLFLHSSGQEISTLSTLVAVPPNRSATLVRTGSVTAATENTPRDGHLRR